MPTQIQLRRGTSTQNNGFTGAVGEVTVNTSNNALRVHDGSTQGGFESALNDLSNVQTTSALSLASIVTTGNVDVGGNLTVTGTTTFNGGTLTLGDADTDNVVFGADVQSSIIPDADDSYALGTSAKKWSDLHVVDITATGNISATGTLSSGNLATLHSLSVTNDADITGNANVTGNYVSAAGNLTLTAGNATVGGTLGVTGEATLASATVSDLTSGRVVLAGTSGALQDDANLAWDNATQVFSVGGSVEVSSTLSVTDAVTLSSTLGVTGLSTLASLSVTNNASVGGDLTVTGNLQVDGTTTTINSTTLDVDDINITVAKGAANAAAANGAGLTVDGANATFTYTSADDRWNINKGMNITGALVPTSDVTYDLGTSSLRWKDLYLSGNTIDLGGTKLSLDANSNIAVTDGSGNLKKLNVEELEFGSGANKRRLRIRSGKLRFDDGADTDESAIKADLIKNTADDLAEGSTNLYYSDARVQSKLADVSGNIVPNANATYDLGSADNQFRDLYLSGNSMYMGTTKIMMHADGYLQFNADHSNNYPAGSNVSVATAANGVAATNGFAVAMAIGLGGM